MFQTFSIEHFSRGKCVVATSAELRLKASKAGSLAERTEQAVHLNEGMRDP